jgi:uncharacterized protein involved in exopolysaccharide biosynthesis
MAEDQSLTVRDILNIIYKKVLILKLVVVLLPLGVLFACLIATPVYEVGTQVIITAKQDPSLLTVPNIGAQRLINLNVDEIDQNSEMEILKSSDVWLRTVKELGADFFVSHSWSPVSQLLKDLRGMIKSTERQEQQDNSELSKQKAIAISLMGRFDVTPVAKSKILQVSLKDSDPMRVQKTLSKALDIYMQYHSQVYYLEGAQEFFSAQLEASKQSYDLARGVLTEYKKKWAITIPERQDNELIATLRMLEDALLETGNNIHQYEKMLIVLKNRRFTTGQLAAGTLKGNENTVSNVIGVQLLQATQKLNQMGQLFTVNSRDYRESQALLEDLYSQFEAAISSEVTMSTIKKNTLEHSLNKVQDQMRTMAERGEVLRALQLDVSVAREQYLQFVAKDQAARMESSEGRKKLVDVKILGQPWLPQTPVFPKTGLYVLLAFVVSFPLGIGIIFVATYLDHSFDEPAGLESATGYKVLATFGTVKGDEHPKEGS